MKKIFFIFPLPHIRSYHPWGSFYSPVKGVVLILLRMNYSIQAPGKKSRKSPEEKTTHGFFSINL
ncbi:MAG: hypothetical protein A2V86_16870 [Deltaproteobacteria bacterium RBG_16_49_23]|nr:MAG: hypothetical protein A2V86_16870 [Deltaproteobacteria bacterium RBG_16_49_23]